MSGQEVLNQDEIDALLNGVDAGAVNTEPAPDARRNARLRFQPRDAHRARPHADARDGQRALRAPAARQPLQPAAPDRGAVGGAGDHEEVQRVHALAGAAHQPQPGARSTRCAARRCSCWIRSWCSPSSTTSSAASAVTPRSKAANSRPPRCASCTCCCAAPSRDMKEAWHADREHRRRIPQLRDQSRISPASSRPPKSWWCARSRSSSKAAAARCTSCCRTR